MRTLLFFFSILTSFTLSFAQDSINDSGNVELPVQTLVLSDASMPELTEDVFVNVKSHSKENGLKLTWSIKYDVLDEIADKALVIKYNTKIGAKRNKKGYEGSDWKYTKPFDISETSFEIKNLIGAEKYVLHIGMVDQSVKTVNKDTEVVWSSKVKAKTERGWGVMKFLILIGSLGLFIFGMKVMSDGMQRTAGERLRKMLGSITSNRFKGVLTGFSSTAIVQSSSVTTVMTVSLVNAGLLNLRQSAGVMMGANIGTTITAWLVLLLGFKVSISSYALVLIAVGAPLLFMSFRKSKDLANAIIGFAI